MVVSSDNPQVGKRSSSPVDTQLPSSEIHEKIDFLELAFDAIFVWNEGDGITEWNRAAERLYGYSKNEALGRQPHELLRTSHPSGADTLLDTQAGSIQRGELRQTDRAGRVLVVECRRQTIRHAKQLFFVETCRELSERNISEKRVLKMLEGIGDGFMSCDADWRIVYLSSPAERILGVLEDAG